MFLQLEDAPAIGTLAFEDRAKFYADPAFAKVPVKGLIAKDYAAERRKLINPDRAAKRFDAGNPALLARLHFGFAAQA